MDRSLPLAPGVGGDPRSALLPALVFAALLWAMLQAGLAVAQPTAQTLAPNGLSAAPAPDAAAILARARATMAEGSALLARRDASPGLSSDPAWLAQQARVIAALEAEYAQAQAAAPSGRAPACLAEGLRLAVEGHQLFQQAFTNDGHGAYYFAAHANWDLNMAEQQLARCGS